MRIERLNKDFQHAYQTLVDIVEELVVNDGKNLQQALRSSEEKLSEWSELSKEEVQEISTELKLDFQNLGMTLQRAKASYKEEFKQDAAYVTDSIWRKLMKIMDSNVVQFLAFDKNLEEQVQEIRKDGYLTNDQEHIQWNSDHELWQTEVALWKIQETKALNKLDEIEKTIKQYSNGLDEYAQVVLAHETREHEELMANAERDPRVHALEVMDINRYSAHKQERHVHKQHAELHVSMKEHHGEMIFLVNKLYIQTLHEAY